MKQETNEMTDNLSSQAFMRCRMPDGSVWKISLEALIEKIPTLLVAQTTPWQKKWKETRGDAGHQYTMAEAQEDALLELNQHDECQLLEMLDWDDIAGRYIVEIPAPPAPTPKELWETWKESSLEWTDGGSDLLEFSLPNE